MKRFYKLLLILPFLLACTLTRGMNAGNMSNLPAAARHPTPVEDMRGETPSPAPLAAQLCNVITGAEDGFLHMRECPGVSCAVIGYLAEGAQIEPLPTQEPFEGWIYASAPGGQGWVNSNFIDCEER